jgi:hypothetical protein
MQQRAPTRSRDASTRSLAALAEEDRAALSGRPRKANAGQYASVMHHAPRKKESAPTFPSGRALLLEVVAVDQRVIFNFTLMHKI